MARPKTGRTKKNLMLTVDEQTRAELAFISQHRQESISSMVSTWAHKEAKRVAKEAGVLLPDIKQTSIFE
ncbi:MAG: hypothetical protein IJZ42_13400 [Lachnospiraceae bacterium]|nr:hypothetical protein [Lachnospiraceae bacterium]